ncbi:MAG: EAL domain-containing protein [Campylobacteraceae bacterium]|nr:EAL domain-containing protein [Campylobacteraceae bacterium]
MALIKKNIWFLFYLLVLGGTVFFLITSYYKWKSLKQKYLLKQENLVSIVSNTTNSLFNAQEMLLNVLGNDLVKNDTYKDDLKISKLLDEMLKLDPNILAFGVATPKGKMITISSNINISNLPNLLKQKSSRESFLYALKTDKMVIGRTYFFKPLQHFIMPIRKSIRDKNGKVIGVINAGIKIYGSSMFFEKGIPLSKYILFNLISTRDHYLQFFFPKIIKNKIYNKPLPQKMFDRVYANLAKKYNKRKEYIKEYIKNSQKIFNIEIKNSRGIRTQAVIKFNKKYEQLIVSQIEIKYIRQEFYRVLVVYFSIFSIVYIVMYILFKYVANFEKQQREHLTFQATHDALTRLPNRIYLKKNIDKWIHQNAKPFSIVFLDMDKFKNVNDSFGHQIGDKLLIELAQRIQLSISDTSLVIRHGGDEFIIFTYKISSIELQKLSTSIIASLSKPYQIDGHNFTLGVSMGIAKFPENGNTLDMLLRASDIAMYEAKKHKNCAYFFADDMEKLYIKRLEIEQELRQALERNEFSLVYQPQCYIDGFVHGVEALIRWDNKKLGKIPPDRFISIAESIGLMPKIGNFIIKQALKDINNVKKLISKEFELSINISVKQFIEQDFLQNLLFLIKKENFNKNRLTLEITENIFIEEVDFILNLLNKIKKENIRISLDDFGTGYSSLSLLKDLPIDEIKIDKSFVDEILTNKNSLNMVKNIIIIGKNLDIQMLAEGTEIKEQIDKINMLGCDLFQGYYYSKPLNKEDLINFLRKS